MPGASNGILVGTTRSENVLSRISFAEDKKIGVSRGDPKISASNPVSQVLW
jgi:hypothetical protein